MSRFIFQARSQPRAFCSAEGQLMAVLGLLLSPESAGNVLTSFIIRQLQQIAHFLCKGHMPFINQN